MFIKWYQTTLAMNKHLICLLVLFIIHLVFPARSYTQSAIDTSIFVSINKERINSHKQAMYVLGGWSVANIAWGAYGMSTSTQELNRSFHEMNLMWNSINISIATFGLISAKKERPSGNSLSTIRSFHQAEQAFLFNTGLDLAYVMSGLYLTELGRTRNADRLIGMGQSIMLQGGFLFIFDLVKYIQTRNKTKGLFKILENSSFYGNGFSHTFKF